MHELVTAPSLTERLSNLRAQPDVVDYNSAISVAGLLISPDVVALIENGLPDGSHLKQQWEIDKLLPWVMYYMALPWINRTVIDS